MENMENENEIGKALEESLTVFDLGSIAKESLSSVFDFLTDNEIVKTIPLVKHIYSGYTAFSKLMEKAEIKKLLIFFSEVNKISDQQRKELIEKMEGSKKHKRQTFERVVLIVQRLDETEKAQILGKLFTNYLLRNISQVIFFRLSFAVDKTFLSSLIALKKLEDSNKIPSGYNAVFVSNEFRDELLNKELTYVGLMTETIKANDHNVRIRSASMGSGSVSPNYEFHYRISELGKQFIQFGF